MARRLAEDAQEIEHKTNLTGFDHKALKDAMEKLVAKREDIATENQQAGEIVKTLEHDQGIETGGFKLAVQFMKMSEERRSDRLRTFFACLKAANLMPQPDLIDLMEGA
jgi:ribosome maturation protein Sdo1